MIDICTSCGAPLTGEYCAQCGQERIHPERETLGGFLRETASSVSGAEGGAVRSLGVVLTRPGKLTRAWIDGNRRTYRSPAQVFLFANLIFFLLAGVAGSTMFTTQLSSHEQYQVYSPLAKDMIRARMVEPDAPDYNTLSQRFDVISEQYARTLVVIMVPLLSLVVAALAFRRGRAAHHVVFALHFYAFALLLYLVSSALAWRVLPLPEPQADRVFAIIAFGLQTAYLAVAFRRAYLDSIPAAIVKGIVASFGAVMIIQVYRFILFILALHAA